MASCSNPSRREVSIRILPGQYADKETNTSYNYFRDYDPAIGRYVQSDPIGLRGGLNTFGYAAQNPVDNIDPVGLQIATALGVAAPVPRPAPSPPGIGGGSSGGTSGNVIPFPGGGRDRPTERPDRDPDCPQLCPIETQVKLSEVKWPDSDHDGRPIPGLVRWQCNYKCPDGYRFTRYITNRLGCPTPLPHP